MRQPAKRATKRQGIAADPFRRATYQPSHNAHSWVCRNILCNKELVGLAARSSISLSPRAHGKNARTI